MRRASASSTFSSEPGGVPAASGRRVALALGVPCLLTIAVIVGTAWWARAWLQSPLGSQTPEGSILPALREWQAREHGDARPGVALLGSSLLDCRDGSSVGEVTKGELARRGLPHALVSVCGGAFGPLQYYYLLDEVLAGTPAVAIIEINLGRLSRNHLSPQLLYPGLSRKLTLRQTMRVRRALALEGVSLVDPFVYRLESYLDVLYVVPGVQLRWQELLDELGWRVDEWLGIGRIVLNWRALLRLRFVAAHALAVFGPDSVDGALTAVLRELRAELHAAGVAVVFYVAPMNLALLDGVGVLEQLRLPERSERLREAVGAGAEEWLDLHALVPGEDFRDWAGHLHPPGCERVGRALADTVAGRSGTGGRQASVVPAQSPGAAPAGDD